MPADRVQPDLVASSDLHPAAQTQDLPVVATHRGTKDLIDRFADEWSELCAASLEPQPFYRPEWIQAYLRACAPGAKLLLISVRLRGQLQLLLPLIEETGTFSKIPVRKLRAPVNHYASRFDAACRASSDVPTIVQAAWNCLRELRWDVLQLRDALEGSTIGRLASLAKAEGFLTIQSSERPSPCVSIPTDPEQLAQLPPNAKLRSQLRQARRRLAELGTLSFHKVNGLTDSTLQRFFELEASGWKGREGSAILCDKQARQFYDEIALRAARNGYLCFYQLQLDEKLLAAHFSFVDGDRCYSPRVAYNEEFSQFAPGHLIIQEILRDCCQNGIRVYDITGQDQDWKMKWTSHARAVHNHFVFKRALGRLAHSTCTAMRPLIGTLLRSAPQ